MPNFVTVAPKAQKFLDKLRDEKLYNRLMHSIAVLKINATPPNSKRLSGLYKAYRLRVGDYRITYVITPAEIIVGEIDHRKDIYR